MHAIKDLKTLPKIDLHRHLEGSLRLETLADIARTHGVDVMNIKAQDMDALRPHVQITDDPPNFENFLAKFNVLRQFYRSPEAVARLTYEAIVDAAADNVKYLELRFSPQALSRVRGFSLDEVTDWVIEATQQATRVCDIEVGLIVTLVRHDNIAQAEDVARVAFERANRGIIGLDLAGDEVNFSALPFRDMFVEARRKGLGVTVHAGEWTDAASVREAIEVLGAHRIGHGVRVIEDPTVFQTVCERNVALEVCLTSNLQTGSVPNMSQHPLRALLRRGAPVTLNTDDPCVSDCTLTDEYELAMRHLGMTYADLRQMTMNAAAAAFLPPAEKVRLQAKFEQLLPPVPQAEHKNRPVTQASVAAPMSAAPA